MAGAEIGDESGGGLRIALAGEMGDDDRRAGGGEHAAGRCTDRAGAADDERDLAVERARIELPERRGGVRLGEMRHGCPCS